MLERPIRHEQPMLEIQVRSTARRAINHLFHETTVLRMDSFQHPIQVGLHRPVVSKDAISFLRPDDFPRGHVPAETAGATQLLGLGQIGLASLQVLLRSFALNRNRRQMGDLSNDSLMLRCRTAWFAREHSEASQGIAFGRENRRGPTRAQPVRQGQVAIVVPQRVRSDVADDDRLFEINRSPARTGRWSDGSAAKGTDVAAREAGSRAVPKPVVMRIQQKNRTERTAGNLLHKPAYSIEDRRQRLALCNHFEKPILSGKQCFYLLQCSQAKTTSFELTLTALQFEARPFDRLRGICRLFRLVLHDESSTVFHHNVGTSLYSG